MGRSIILLVSEQPMPNLLAALEPSLDITTAHLVASGDMVKKGRVSALEQVLKERGVTVHQHPVSDVFRLEETRNIVAKILSERAEPEDFIVNITGGTKIMSLGAYRAAFEGNVRGIVYVDHKESRLHWPDGNRLPQPCGAKISTEEILSAQGWFATAKKSKQPSNTDIHKAIALHEMLSSGILNDWNSIFYESKAVCLIKKGGKKGQWVSQGIDMLGVLKKSARPKDPENKVTQRLKDLEPALRCAADIGLCKIDGDYVTIASKYDQQFLCGGWFEVVVYTTLQKQQEALGLDELSLNSKLYDGIVEEKDRRSENEFDVIARRGDRLFIIEVKTARFGGSQGPKVNDVFYRLDSLRKTFGLTAEAALVSRMPVTGDPIKRFERGKIGLIAGEGAAPANLADALAEWIGPALVRD